MSQNLETSVSHAKKSKKQAGECIPLKSPISATIDSPFPVKELLSHPDSLAILKSGTICTPGDEGLGFLLDGLRNIGYDNVKNAEDIQKLGFGLIQNEKSELHTALLTLRATRQALKNASSHATHQERRKLAFSLGLNRKSYSAADLIAPPSPSSDILNHLPSIKIVWRSRSAPGPIRKWVTESIRLRDDDIVASAENGYYIVEEDESVIFLSSPGESDDIDIELVVMRQAIFEFELHAEFYNWLQNVVQTACIDRRNTRPDHPGSLVQLGWNAGPRDARVYGLAKSYSRSVDSDTMVDRDNDAIAVLTIMWGLVKGLIPQEIVSEVNQCLDAEGMPRIATRNVKPGCGYEFTISGKTFNFPYVERAPPEGYMSQDYVAWVHTDPAYAKYAFAWCVGRYIDPKPWAPHENSRYTRAASKLPSLASTSQPKPGGSFVEVELKVIVRQAQGTLVSFKPDHQHATSRLFNAHNRLCSINFSSRILEAFKIAKEDAHVAAGAGAGDGDENDY